MMVYLLHFSRPYKHARHYLGTTQNLEKRLALHRSGNGARLLAVIREQGIGFVVARTWDGGRDEELKLKKRKESSRLCPICYPAGYPSKVNGRYEPPLEGDEPPSKGDETPEGEKSEKGTV